MPPKAKFTREEIIQAALKIVSERGVDALTARELGKELNSSARPIFTLFASMDEVQTEVYTAALKRYENAVKNAKEDMPQFKRAGMQMALFGRNEPKLYQFLFMRENAGITRFDDILEKLGQTAQNCVEVLERDHNLEKAKAKKLFENVWIYTFGLGALCATGVCKFDEEEISQLLSVEFQAALAYVKKND